MSLRYLYSLRAFSAIEPRILPVHCLCTTSKESRTQASVSNVQDPTTKGSLETGAPDRAEDGVRLYYNQELSSLGKKVLVWTKEYPNLESIPDRVLSSKVKRSHDKMRVKVAFILSASFLFLCGIVIVEGKYLRSIGKSKQMDDHTYKAIGIAQPDEKK